MRILLALLLLILPSLAQTNNAHLSLKLEIKRAIKTGNQFLLRNPKRNGCWSDPENPALTALVLTALQRSPINYKPAEEETIQRGLQWLLQQQKEDGGFYSEGLATYNTSTAIMALLATEDAQLTPVILKARAFLIGQQTDWGVSGSPDNAFDGGIGYGGTYKHSDMSNTHLALEALYHSKRLALDDQEQEQPELDWSAALTFITRCQNLTTTNDQNWASDTPSEKGGFVYFPGDSKAGIKKLKDQTTALRSYGSMSYAGLLSLIFADLRADDPRVKACLEWLAENYSIDENPGLGQQGLYYYYQAMAKSLAASGRDSLITSAGEEIDWRKALGTKLVSTQNSDGSWLNSTSRWWENDNILVTAYAVLALEQLYYTL